MAQVSGKVDRVVTISQRDTTATSNNNNPTRDQAIEAAIIEAKEKAISAGADPSKPIEIVEITEIPLNYLPGSITRIKVVAIGEMKDIATTTNGSVINRNGSLHHSLSELTIDTTNGFSSTSNNDKTSTTTTTTTTTTGTTENGGETYQKKRRRVIRNGEWYLNEFDVECIAIGAGIVGCGGNECYT